MKSTSIAVVTGLLIAPVALARGAGLKTPARVMACLSARQVLTNSTNIKIVAPGSPQQAGVGVSFALISGVSLNTAGAAFEKSDAIAQTVGKQWATYEIAHYKKEGVHVTAAMVKQIYYVKDNVVVVWDSEPGTTTAGRARARAILNACI